jgi:hypothetical protein
MRVIMSFKNIQRLILTVLWLCIAAVGHAEDLHDAALNRVLQNVKDVYEITLHYTELPAEKFAGLNYSLADLEDKDALIETVLIFVNELKAYPKNFFKNAGCQDIYFVQKLFINDRPVEGAFSTATQYIFYDYSRSHQNKQKMRHNIHHELFHMIGSKHSFWAQYGRMWLAVNRPGFVYNPKDYNMHAPNPLNNLATAEPGFITAYAMASPEEDRAETFACFMIPEERALMQQWAQKDVILQKKLGMMTEFVKEIFRDNQ